MSKYDVLADVAEKVQVLGNDVKLKILALLIEEGSKSITDISQDLDINFSTTHKYLEQLQAAGLVASRNVSENRLKRIFTIKDFDIQLSPKGISELINGKTTKEIVKKGLKVLNEKGELVNFDDKLFSQKYLKRGLPQGTIVSALSAVLEQAYDGITLLELRRLFRQELENKVEKVEEVFAQIEADGKHKRTFEHLLEMVHPEALDMHANGDIFIKNLREPKLLNFVHDLRGIGVHGVRGKKISTLADFLSEILYVINKIKDFTPIQALDSFNTCLAPFAKTLTRTEISNRLKAFFNDLTDLNVEVFVSLDLGLPKFINLPIEYLPGERGLTYSEFKEAAQIITEETIKLFKANQAKFDLVLKIWDKADLSIIKDMENIYVANMKPRWQNLNASYIGPFARFDAEWKSWLGTQRVGEVQNITINLPRIAFRTKNTERFFKELKIVINNTIEYIYNIGELVIAEFFRKHSTSLTSVKQERWSYVPIENCTYTISITGLNETIKILTGHNIDQNLKSAETILKFCEQNIKQKVSAPIRIILKEDQDLAVARRFYILDSKDTKLPVSSYTTGTGCQSSTSMCKLQKYFSGGHCAYITKNELSGIKDDFGLVFIER